MTDPMRAALEHIRDNYDHHNTSGAPTTTGRCAGRWSCIVCTAGEALNDAGACTLMLGAPRHTKPEFKDAIVTLADASERKDKPGMRAALSRIASAAGLDEPVVDAVRALQDERDARWQVVDGARVDTWRTRDVDDVGVRGGLPHAHPPHMSMGGMNVIHERGLRMRLAAQALGAFVSAEPYALVCSEVLNLVNRLRTGPRLSLLSDDDIAIGLAFDGQSFVISAEMWGSTQYCVIGAIDNWRSEVVLFRCSEPTYAVGRFHITVTAMVDHDAWTNRRVRVGEA